MDSYLAYSSIMKMEAIYSSEILSFLLEIHGGET
jgi:hypothetical protein